MVLPRCCPVRPARWVPICEGSTNCPHTHPRSFLHYDRRLASRPPRPRLSSHVTGVCRYWSSSQLLVGIVGQRRSSDGTVLSGVWVSERGLYRNRSHMHGGYACDKVAGVPPISGSFTSRDYCRACAWPGNGGRLPCGEANRGPASRARLRLDH